jgi:hypothetical protein
MLDPDIIAMGIVRGKHVLLICNQAGVNKLPDPVRIEKGEGWHERDGSISKSFYVWIEATKANAIALVMGGWLTSTDANKLLEGA